MWHGGHAPVILPSRHGEALICLNNWDTQTGCKELLEVVPVTVQTTTTEYVCDSVNCIIQLIKIHLA